MALGASSAGSAGVWTVPSDSEEEAPRIAVPGGPRFVRELTLNVLHIRKFSGEVKILNRRVLYRICAFGRQSARRSTRQFIKDKLAWCKRKTRHHGTNFFLRIHRVWPGARRAQAGR